MKPPLLRKTWNVCNAVDDGEFVFCTAVFYTDYANFLLLRAHIYGPARCVTSVNVQVWGGGWSRRRCQRCVPQSWWWWCRRFRFTNDRRGCCDTRAIHNRNNKVRVAAGVTSANGGAGGTSTVASDEFPVVLPVGGAGGQLAAPEFRFSTELVVE